MSAISSVSNQNYENIELIVIDGNSGLDVTNLLRENNNEIDIWLSEDDNGLWDAWNKGFKLARGDFVGVVNSSNFLYENSMNILKDYIINYKEIDFI